MDHEDLPSMASSDEERAPDDAIFIRNGIPILIHLHKSIGPGGRKALSEKITEAGGDPTVSETEAEVIICRDDHPAFKDLEFQYDHFRFVWVEPPAWVHVCIRNQKYEHALASRPNRNQPRRGRTEFSAQDDQHLVKFLALRIPFKDSGGRLGRGVYEDLCKPEREHLYPWANNHSWQSWRERYKKNQDIFDQRIAYAVSKEPELPEPGGKGQYIIPQRRKPLSLRHAVDYEDDMYEEMEEEEVEEEGGGNEQEVPKDLDNPGRRRLRELPQQRSVSPPRKRSRTHLGQRDQNADNVPVLNKGKGRQTSPESDRNYNDVVPDGADVPMASLFDDPPLHADLPDASVTLLKPMTTLGPRRAEAPTAKVLAARKQLFAPPPPPRTSKLAPSIASSSKVLPNSQMTLIGSSQVPNDAHIPPPDTQATLVHASQPDPRPRARRAAPAPQPIVPRITRSRARPASAEPAPVAHLPAAITKRGSKKSVRQTEAEASFPSIEDESQRVGVSISGSFRDEVRVEELLQSDGANEELVYPADYNGSKERNRSGSSDESFSSDDDEATKTLIAKDKKMFVRASSPSSKARSSTEARLRHIDLASQASSSRRGTVTLNARGQEVVVYERESDADVTPKAKPRGRAAKKTAALPIIPDSSDSDAGAQSETTNTGTTSSFPAEDPLTAARQYKIAQVPFTPAAGTRAEERVRSERTMRAKGKEKVR